MNEEYYEELERHNRKIVELLTRREELDRETKDILEGIRDELDLNVNVDFPDDIKVNNFPEQKELKFPEIQRVKVDNQIEIPESFEIKNLKLPEFPKEIRVSNFPKQDTKSLEDHLTKLFTGLWDALKQNVSRVIVRNKNPEEAIPVRLVTAEGKEFYTILSHGGSGGGGGGTASSVTITSDHRSTPFNQFGEDTAVVSETSTTIASYTVPAGKTANIEGFLVNGSASGRYKLKVAGSVKAVVRTSAAQRTVNTEFNHGTITATAGQAVVVTGFHEETANQTMDANVFGYLT